MYRLKRSLLALLIVISAITFDTAFIAYGSTFHRQWLRNKVASKVFEIRGGIEHSSGGATGFAIKGLSGMSYIITNAHVCEEVLRETKSQNLLFVKKDGHLLKRRVLEIFDTTDLCLIEGWPGVEGLSVGKDLDIGSVVYEVGHPHLMPTSMVEGELFAYTNLYAMRPFPDKTAHLSLHRFEEVDAMETTVPTFPGNSGSPLVDTFGNVVGIIYATDLKTSWGYAVNLENISFALKDF